MADLPRGGPATAEPRSSEHDELERLRAEVAELRAAPPPRHRAARAGRWTGAVALIVLGALLLGIAGLSVFVRNQLLDTDRYVETVTPLADDPALQEAVTNRLTDEIINRVDVEGLVTSGLTFLEGQGLPPQLTSLAGPITGGLRSFLSDEIGALVRSDTFDQAWIAANRAAHTGLVTVLTGGDGRFITTSGTSVSVDLGAVLSAVKDRLAARGFTLVEQIPDVSVQFTVLDSPDIPRLQNAVAVLDTVATWLPWVALLLLVAGVFVAPNRRRGLLTAALSVVAVALIVLAGLAVVRRIYLIRIPPDVLPLPAATVLYDTLLRFLVAGATTVLVLAVVIALAALVAGPSGPARWLRTTTGRGLDAVGGALAGTGVPAGPFRPFTRYRVPIEIALVVLAAVGFLLWNRPTTSVVVWFAVVTLVLIGLVEVLARCGQVVAARADA